MQLIRHIAIGLILACVPMTAAADKNASARMQRLLMHYDKILAIPEAERTLIRPAYRVKARGVDQSEIKAWYELDGERVDIVFDNRGVIMNLPDQASYDANPKVYTNQPRKNLVLAMRIRPNIPLDTRMDGDALAQSITQADQGMKRATGLMAMFKPKLKGFSVEVLPDTVVTLFNKDGSEETLSLTRLNHGLSKVILSNDTLSKLDYVDYSQPPKFMRYYDGKN